jgi:hypothetical protein
MDSRNELKMSGINLWFIIEILSFYGYILSAVIFIIMNICRSSLGWLPVHPERHKHDFVSYHRKDLDWAAFVQILFQVNMALILIDHYVTYENKTKEQIAKNYPLMNVQY